MPPNAFCARAEVIGSSDATAEQIVERFDGRVGRAAGGYHCERDLASGTFSPPKLRRD